MRCQQRLIGRVWARRSELTVLKKLEEEQCGLIFDGESALVEVGVSRRWQVVRGV